ncbi:MAG: DEAD/DEAH box helicase [archaeon]|nr:DEAD/DEAH box helicase [archaeon]
MNRNFATLHITSFNDFLMRDELKKTIKDLGFEHPSEVQQQCLPNSLLGLDILCQAKAGMGKSAVFILTILNRILSGDIHGESSVLVLAHTRELALQLSKEFVAFSKGMDIKSFLVIGGERESEQIVKLKNQKPNIIIGTPGRILGLLRLRSLNLDNVQAFIVDECDKMLSALGNNKLIIFYYRYES